jgi:enoyl-CoA hydratase/carnithine racemase
MTNRIVTVAKKEQYVVVTLQCPDNMNALSRLMIAELTDAFVSIEKDETVRVVVITGGDYIFCAGMDLKEMSSLAEGEISDYFGAMTECLKTVYSFKKPVIAAVGGIAFGGGFNLATVCDLIVASEAALFAHPEIKFGLNPLFDPLVRMVGHLKAKEITMIGDPIGAQEALKIGLVNKVVSPEKLMATTEKLAREIAGKPPQAIEAIKRISDIVPRLDKSTALEYEFETSALLFSRSGRRDRLATFLHELQRRKKK